MCAARPTVSWLCNHPTRSRQVSVTVALFRRRSDRSTIKARAPLGRSLHRELFSKVREGGRVGVLCAFPRTTRNQKEPVNARNTPIGDGVWMYLWWSSSTQVVHRCAEGSTNFRLSSVFSESRRKEVRSAIAIWLILPVVIRLSQRLSHACLSINESIL